MLRVACFVDFSNLLGSLGKMNLKVDDYEHFFSHIVKEACEPLMKNKIGASETPLVMLNRVYWYAVGSCDFYNFGDAKTKEFLEKLFNENKEIKGLFLGEASKNFPELDQTAAYRKAVESFFESRKTWYAERQRRIKGFTDFYDKVRRQCDFIDITECGHWRLDFISKDVDEKGIDTALAVDSVTISDTYDVALIVSGDADMIPSINFLKRQGKYVGVISFIKGSPPENKGRQQSKRLSRAADFDVQVYETDLVRHKIAHQLKADESEM